MLNLILKIFGNVCVLFVAASTISVNDSYQDMSDVNSQSNNSV